jgi:hypothetical protein
VGLKWVVLTDSAPLCLLMLGSLTLLWGGSAFNRVLAWMSA